MGKKQRGRSRQPAHLNKAASSSAVTFSTEQVAALMAANRLGGQTTGVFPPLPRTDPPVAFGPGVPLYPAAIDPPRPDSGRPEPRLNEYPVSSNLPGMSDRLVPWKVLRDAADAGGLPRRCIEIRKNEVASLGWTVRLTEQAIERAQEGSEQPDHEVAKALRQQHSAEITRVMDFLERPDRGQGETTTDWLTKLLEEHFVLDAIAIYPRRTFGGDLYAFEVLDGSTIKPLRDHRGGRPQPPNPAYQQLLWGFPRGEFIADTDADGAVLNGYRSDHLVYRRRNVRAHTPYGYSAVEQCLEDLDVWLRRRSWIKAEYTDGTVPSALVTNSGASGWSPAQLKEYETFLNDAYGPTGARHRLRILPPGMELGQQSDAAERYRPEYDLFLIKLMVAHFDTTIAELGFTEQGGLGSTGWHEGQASVQRRKGTLPTVRWLQDTVTDILRLHLRMHRDLEFAFLGLEEEDEAAADAVDDARYKSGRLTLNEARDRAGKPRYDFPEADKPVLVTTRGVVFLEGAADQAAPGAVIGPAKGTDEAPEADEPDEDDADIDEEGAADPERAQAVKVELAAFRRWARRNPAPSRPFRFTVVTKADAPDVNGEIVLFAEPEPEPVDGGGAVPKAPSSPDTDRVRDWPGWSADRRAAAYWKPRIIKAMGGALDARALAERWIAQRGITAKADEPDLGGVQPAGGGAGMPGTPWHDAVGWLAAQNISLIRALLIVREIQTDGYVIGERSALAVLAGHSTVDWSKWSPGDPDAARLLRPGGPLNGLQALLDESGIVIRGVAANRMNRLAKVLSDALARGDSADTTALAIQHLLRDPAWAERVAVTEIARAVSAASLNTYRANGVRQKSWFTAVDERVCPVCMNNEAAGAIPLSQQFPSGHGIPPGHPSCRCVLMPEGLG
ncbi:MULTISPECIES: phage minor head protein [Streptomyces]|uniref:Minor capsid protein n=1 Tax=Streptomyces doudnae TaxID=3075536 RepID=A0ABD5EMW7_9ACTN|nr:MULTISPECIES: phage minor head protein [unclassified Streptomyces]MDT0435612.1 minor capsid protein [Streptomyces sp. DSM 41981]SCD40053.1 phage putative head morphogenesis protein, SPP1 gp7 family [Streptomyces sp. SolWspMP-5a-2]